MSIADSIIGAVTGGRPHTYLYDGQTQVIFDVMTNRSRRSQNQVTQHPVESGSDISDHVIKKPDAYSLKIVLSDDMLDPLSPSSFVSLTVQQRLDQLSKWDQANTILQYFGYAGKYHDDVDSVVIESKEEIQSLEAGSGVILNLNLKRIVIVSAGTGQVGSLQVQGQTAPSEQSLPANTRGSSDLLRLVH